VLDDEEEHPEGVGEHPEEVEDAPRNDALGTLHHVWKEDGSVSRYYGGFPKVRKLSNPRPLPLDAALIEFVQYDELKEDDTTTHLRNVISIDAQPRSAKYDFTATLDSIKYRTEVS
jgi:hypothetical protein